MAVKTRTKKEWQDLAASNPYWAGRWDYLSVVIQLIKKFAPQSVLEIGANGFPLCLGSDTLDIIGSPTILWDANSTPYPLGKRYDLAIGLQVWEHLEQQQKAFDEVCRLSNRVILSFPYKWNCPADPMHHGIDEKTIAEWTGHKTPVHTQIVGRRIIYVWRNEK